MTKIKILLESINKRSPLDTIIYNKDGLLGHGLYYRDNKFFYKGMEFIIDKTNIKVLGSDSLNLIKDMINNKNHKVINKFIEYLKQYNNFITVDSNKINI